MKHFQGVVVVADSLAGVATAYNAVATGRGKVAYMQSVSSDGTNVFATELGSIGFDPLTNVSLKPFNEAVSASFANDGENVEAMLSVCTDGCQRFIMSDAPLHNCPSCSAKLSATEDDIHDLAFGSESSDDLLDVKLPVFCGTSAQADQFIQALRTGAQFSVSGDEAAVQFDAHTGLKLPTAVSCSGTAEFSGAFHRFQCAAECSHPVTVSESSDVLFCSHCNAPLQEPSTMKKIAKIENQRMHAFAPSLSGALNGFRSLLLKDGNVHSHDNKTDAAFLSASASNFNPYSGDGVKTSLLSSLSSSAAALEGKDGLRVHLMKCSSGCGFLALSSAEGVFCSECNAPLVDPSEEDLADVPEGDAPAEDEDIALDALDSDLAELGDEDDMSSESGEEDEFDDIEEDDLSMDEGEGEEFSLSGDDFDGEGDELPDFDDEDEEDDDLDSEDDEDDLDDEGDLDLTSTSSDEGDDEGDDENLMIGEDEMDELDFEEDGEDDAIDEAIESESVSISISMAESIDASGDFDVQSLSTMFDGKAGGKGRWYAMYQGQPLGHVGFTALSTAVGDEATASRLFQGALPAALSASAATNGLSVALSEMGFEPIEFELSVSKVLHDRARGEYDAKVDSLSSDVEALYEQRTKRLEASLSTAMLGNTRRFWRNSRNPVAESLIAQMSASGIDAASAREMVSRSFAEHGEDLVAQTFVQATELASMSAESFNQIAETIADMEVASVSSVSIGKSVARPTKREEDTERKASVSSAKPLSELSFNERLKALV